MSTPSRLAEVEAILREYPCGQCQAKVGQPCRTAGGRNRRQGHEDRTRQADAAERFPLGPRRGKS